MIGCAVQAWANTFGQVRMTLAASRCKRRPRGCQERPSMAVSTRSMVRFTCSGRSGRTVSASFGRTVVGSASIRKLWKSRAFAGRAYRRRGCVSTIRNSYRYAEGDDPCEGPRADCERDPACRGGALHHAGQSVRERLLRKLQLKTPRRTARWRNLLHAQGGDDHH